MKLGIVGAGSIVAEFLPKLREVPGLDVVGIMARRPEAARKLCEENEVSLVTASFDELCEAGVDTIYVAVPNLLHYSYCKAALERGLHVIVEKPVTGHSREAVALRDMAKAKNLFLFEAITTLYLGTYRKIQEWLPRIGEVKNVESIYTQRSRRYDAFRQGDILPAFDPRQAGGALMDLNLYNVHFVMGLFGVPEEAKYYPTLERGIDTNGRLILRYPSFTANCFAAKDCGGVFGSTIQGTKGVIRTAYPPNLVGPVTIRLDDGTEETFDDQSAYERMLPEFNAFAKAIDGQDYDFCHKMLDQSVAVSEIMTRARIESGIVFPCD